MDKDPIKNVSKEEAKHDALDLVRAAIQLLRDNPWKTRQDQRAANKVYTCLLSAESALTLAKRKEVEEDDSEMLPPKEDK